jgi:peptide/nickel transport system substrate-binding protein
MPRKPVLSLTVALAVAVSALVGCSPPATPAPGVSATNRTEATGSAPKVLTIGILREPNSFHSDLNQGTGAQGGNTQVLHIPQNYLTVQNARGEFQAQLAAEQIAVERGTWRVNADGSMDTTWKLRPNIRWHDGTPFTSDDLLFSFNVYKDPEVPTASGGALRLMTSASASDPQTFVVHWSSPYVRADEAQALIPMARHLLEDVYRTDKPSFANSPRFTTEFVGLGPYHLVSWEGGVQMDFARFDDYYLGRPPLDRVVVRFLADANTMVANLLSGAVDVLLPIGVDLDAALDVKRRWEGTGNQVTTESSGRLRHLEIQHRPDYEQPKNGFTNTTVRQAFYHAIDRATLADVMAGAAANSADSWFPPNHALRAQLEPFIPQFPYDPARAQQLLTQVGWLRGADGILVNQTTGDRFEILLHGSASTRTEREQHIIADGWKAIGAQVNLYIIPAALANDREYRSTLTGAGLIGVGYDAFYTDRLHSSFITSPANRWNGANRGGYNNPRVDAILDRLVVTIAPDRRLELHKELLREQLGDVATMPLYWDIDPVLSVKGVKNIGGNAGVNTWNMFEWDKEV